jgi:ArsR family transcriptional regulator
MHIDAETLFRMLADPTRLRILILLTAEGELCVCELTRALGLSQPKISRHLAHLRESSLLRSHRAGQWMYYRINPSLPDWAQSILQQTLAGNRDTQPFIEDRHGLDDMPNRPGTRCCA